MKLNLNTRRTCSLRRDTKTSRPFLTLQQDTTHSKVQIYRKKMLKGTTFLVFLLCFCHLAGVFGAVKSVSVMEGDSTTLDTSLTEIKRDDDITWMFGTNKNLIANNKGVSTKIQTIFAGKFIDRLKVDHQTGSLTITNIKPEHAGDYELEISSSTTETKHSFTVTVYDRLPVPVITSESSNSSSVQNCSVVCSVENVNAVVPVSLSWYKENSLVSNISVSDLDKSISLLLECLDGSYSCVVAYSFASETTNLTQTEFCQECPAPTPTSTSQAPLSTIDSSSQSSSNPATKLTSQNTPVLPDSYIIMTSAAGVAVSLLTVAIVGIIWLCRNNRKTGQAEPVQTHVDEVTYADPKFFKKNENKSEDEVVYAGIVTKR